MNATTHTLIAGTDQPQAQRRHDLDMLRASAMLLGIVLHAALAFLPIPWLAMNKETAPALGPLVEIIHGFRLPLFFLMSGFFSAMLLHRRGIRGFLHHRMRRIALPLLLGMVTVIPLMWLVILGGNAIRSVAPAPQREWGAARTSDNTIWRAAASGDPGIMQQLVQSGEPVNEPDPAFLTLPLAWAATGDHAAVIALLLDAGADPNQRMGDDNTPLHTACFFGAADSAALMLDAGADPAARNRYGETPIDSMRHERATVEFIANLLGVSVEFEQVESGRQAIAQRIQSRAAEADAGPAPGPAGPAHPLRDLLTRVLSGELFMHLWFLWHLCWLACGLATATAVLRTLPWRGAPAPLIATPLCLVGLVPLTAITQSWQSGFGPDTSAALLPAPHVLAHYAVFFGFGALMHRTSGAADRLGRAWWLYLPLAAASCFIALRLTHDPAAFADRGLDAHAGALLHPVLQSAFVWTVSFGLIGLARLAFSQPSKLVRYVSDSSYWLYLAHLPVVVAGQLALTYVPLPPVIEFALLSTVTTAVLLLSYHRLVRYTWIGRLLNGPRTRPRKPHHPSPQTLPASAIGQSSAS